jgi:membrane-associated protease RseP (regulator of RpoE activity)
MNMNRVMLLVAVILAPALWAADNVPLGSSNDAASSGRQAAADALQARAAVNIAWSALDAQQKAMNFLNSHQAHRDAIVSLQQCRHCHNGNSAAWVLNNAVSALQPQGPWVGISVGPADGVLRSQLRLPEGTGVVVTQVVPQSPAQQAGIEEHDILLSVNGKPVASSEDLDRIIQSADADAPLTLKVLRAGQTLDKQVTPQKQAYVAWLEAVKSVDPPSYRIGVGVSDPDPTLRKQLKLGDTGVVITEVQPGKPAEMAGVKAGDVLLSINEKPVTRQEALPEEIQKAGETVVELELMRGGVKLRLSVTPVKEPGGPAANYDATYLDNVALSDQARELMLVHPRSVQVLSDFFNVSATQPATQPAAAPTADRLKQITDQLEQLRQAVDALRTDLEKQQEKTQK